MKNRLKLIKQNLPIILIGVGILITIIVIITLFTDFNPIIIGSATGIALSFIIPAIIFRINIKNIESNKNGDKNS